MIPSCGCSYDIVLKYVYIKIIVYIATFVKMFASSLLSGLFLMLYQFLEKCSESCSPVRPIYKTLCLEHCATWIISLSFQFPVPFIFSVMFNLLLVMSLAVFICGQSFHKVLRWNEVANLQYLFQKVIRKRSVFSMSQCRFLFENFWKFG